MRMRTIRGAIVTGLAVSGLVLGAMPGLGQTQAQDQLRTQDQQRTRQQTWDRQAEETFALGRGAGRQLMTQEEWAEHQRKMQTMTANERLQYRQDMHARLQQRAKEKGITLPDAPGGPMSGAPGQGMGPGGGAGAGGGGMGPGGGGMGPGGGAGAGGGTGKK